MAACIVTFCHDVEEKWLHIVVKGFVVKEELGHQAKVLTIDLVLLAIHLKKEIRRLTKNKQEQQQQQQQQQHAETQSDLLAPQTQKECRSYRSHCQADGASRT